MMKLIRFKWKYVLASIGLANLIACTNDGIPQVDMRQEQVGSSRTTELVTQTVELQAAGTLQAELEALMGDSAVTTLQKLVLSGPFTSTDMTYLRDSLIGLSVLDMKDVEIKASDVPYRDWIIFQDNQVCESMFYQMDGLREVILPSTITAIGNEAFYDCDSLRMVAMPDQIKSIGNWAFHSCDSLKSVTLPSSLETLGSYAFNYNSALTTIVIPEGVKRIEYQTFADCRSLTSVTLPSALEVIAGWAFAHCPITSIHLPASLKVIGGYAFYNTSLASTDLPVGLEKIESYAFYYCRNLKKMTIPETVTEVYDSFVSGSGLLSLVWNAAIDVPYSWGVENCFLFVDTDRIGVYDVNNWKSIVINGLAETTIDVNYGSWNGEFANLTEFTAKKLVYSRHFGDETVPGGSSGWQTIVLPFSPDSIYHETKGQIAPFNSGIEGAKPFWLRELTSEGFVDVTKIEANKPYIIAMPNHGSYLDEYCLNGNITFVGKNQVFSVTPEVLDVSVGPDFELHPTYKYLENSDAVYSLGSQWGHYEEENMYYYKSFFMKNWNSVSKFNAYATPLGGGRSSRSTFDLDTRSKETRVSYLPNKTGIPQIGDM